MEILLLPVRIDPLPMKRYLPFAIVGLVLFVAVGSGILLFRFRKEKITPKIAQGVPGAEPPHIRGSKSATVTLEEFGDFECPPCGELSPVLEKLEKDYADSLRVIFRESPLANHHHAFAAACAAEAAGLQGRFWEMHDALYHNRFVWRRASDVEASFSLYAENIGLDVERFKKDMNGENVKARIAADQKRGASLGVDRTPVLYINGQHVPLTSFGPDGLRAMIDAAVKPEKRK